MFRVVCQGKKWAYPRNRVNAFPGTAPDARRHCTGPGPDCRVAGVTLATSVLGIMLQGLPHSPCVTYITASADRNGDTGLENDRVSGPRFRSTLCQNSSKLK